MSEFGTRINGVDFATVFGDSSKGNDVIQVPAKTGFCVVDIVDQCFNVLFRAYSLVEVIGDRGTLIEGNDNETRSLGTVTSVHGLVILGDFPGVSTGCDKDSCTTRDQSLKNLRTNTTSPSARNKNILILKRDTILRSLFQTFQIQTSQSLVVFPSTLLLLLQMQKRNSLLPSLYKSRCIPPHNRPLSLFLSLLLLKQLIINRQCPINLRIQTLDL